MVNARFHTVVRCAVIASSVVTLSCSGHQGTHDSTGFDEALLIYKSQDSVVVQKGSSVVARHQWNGSDLVLCQAYPRWALWMEHDRILWLDVYDGTTGTLVQLDTIAGLSLSKPFDTWAISPGGESIALMRLPLEVWLVDLSASSARRILHEDKMREAAPARSSEEVATPIICVSSDARRIAFSYSSGNYLYWAAGDFAPATYVFEPASGVLTRLGEGAPVGWLDAEHVLVMRTWVGSQQHHSLVVYDAEGRVRGSLDDVAAAATDGTGGVMVVRSRRDKHGDYSGGVQRLAEVEAWTLGLSSLTGRFRLAAPLHPGDSFVALPDSEG